MIVHSNTLEYLRVPVITTRVTLVVQCARQRQGQRLEVERHVFGIEMGAPEHQEAF